MKLLISLAPLAAFFIAYRLGGIYPATATLVIALLAACALDWWIEKRLNKMLAFGAAVAGVLGALTFAFHSTEFIKLKPTVVDGIMGLVLLGSHYIGDQVLLQRFGHGALQMPTPVWRKLNFAWAMFFLFCAVLNLYVAQNFPEDVWVKFKVIVFTALPFAFALAQLPFLYRYIESEPGGKRS